MAAAKKTTTHDINALIALKQQVDKALSTEVGKLGEAVISRGFQQLQASSGAVKPGYQPQDPLYSHTAALDVVESLLPDAVVDVTVTKGGLLGGKRLSSVRVHPRVGASSEYVGSSTAPHADPAWAVASALINALVDQARRVSAAQRNGTVSSVNAPKGGARNGEEVLLDTEVQGRGADVAKERERASGVSRTSLRPVGFQAPATQRKAGSTTGSLKNPASARIPAEPKR